uniref:THUMP domain-containing protein n=1 Tax=Kalanchoe fedtschenkoi TaxID=63787 RepID=A0A7N0U3M2_KALFE
MIYTDQRVYRVQIRISLPQCSTPFALDNSFRSNRPTQTEMATVGKPSNGKKRKQYLAHNKPVKKKGWYPLHPGVQGFFITCDGGRERQASHEAIEVIDSFYEELVNGPTPSVKVSALVAKPMNKKIVFDDSDSSGSDDDEEEVKAKEAEVEKVEDKLDNGVNGNDVQKKPANDDEEKSANEETDLGGGGEETKDVNEIKVLKNGDDNVGEVREILPEEAEGPQPKKLCVEAGEPKKVELSVDRLIEAELQELGDRNKRRFVNLDTGCNGMAFVQMHKRDGDPSPKQIVQHMMTLLASTKKHVSRFILRLLPVEVSCYASEDEISKAIKPSIEQYFPMETETPLKFAVIYEARANSGADRMKIINCVAKAVPPPHKVDLSNPDVTILVQIIKTVCLIGFAEKYKELSKYNVRQLTSSGTSS